MPLDNVESEERFKEEGEEEEHEVEIQDGEVEEELEDDEETRLPGSALGFLL